MTISEFIKALHTEKVILFLDGNEFRDDNLDCPLVALYNAGLDHCSENFDNSEADAAGQALGLDVEDIEDIVGISDGEDAEEISGDPNEPEYAAHVIRRHEIQCAFHSIVEQHAKETTPK